jgi:hypothetical protein
MRKSILSAISIAIALASGSTLADDQTDRAGAISLFTSQRLIASYCKFPLDQNFFVQEDCVKALFGPKVIEDGEKMGRDRFSTLKDAGCDVLKLLYDKVSAEIEKSTCTKP